MSGDAPTFHHEAGPSEWALRQDWWAVGRGLPPNRSVILREAGVAKSVVRVFWRDAVLLSMDGEPIVTLKAAGIGWVFTREDCRGRGLAHAVLKETHRWLYEDMGIPAAFLYSRTHPGGLYEALGYTTIRELTHPKWKEPKRLMGLSLVPGIRIEEGQWTLLPEDPF